jgi:hypothetical protein
MEDLLIRLACLFPDDYPEEAQDGADVTFFLKGKVEVVVEDFTVDMGPTLHNEVPLGYYWDYHTAPESEVQRVKDKDQTEMIAGYLVLKHIELVLGLDLHKVYKMVRLGPKTDKLPYQEVIVASQKYGLWHVMFPVGV